MMDPKLVKPKPVNDRWVWVCVRCEAPVVVISRRYFWGCECYMMKKTDEKKP